MINLLPPEVKESFRFAKYNVVLVRYAFVTILAIAVMTSLMFYGKSSLTSQAEITETGLANDRAEVADLEKINAEAEKLSGAIDTIATILDREVRFSLLLQEIGSIMPSGTVLSAVSLSQDTEDPIRMSVSLNTAEKAGVLQQNLIESRLFVSADIVNVSTISGQTNGYPFAGDIVAYYDPSFSLATLDDLPVEASKNKQPTTPETATEADEPNLEDTTSTGETTP